MIFFTELSNWKTLIEFFESVVTIIGIIVGGLWTYNKFIKKREKFPRASVSHRIFEIDLNEDKKLVHLFVLVENIGDVLLSIASYDVRINKIIPLDAAIEAKISRDEDPVTGDYHEILWPLIYNREKEHGEGNVELEPKEKEEVNFDFVMDKDVKVIQIYSYFKNKMKSDREIGWSCTTFHELDSKKRSGQMEEQSSPKPKESKDNYFRMEHGSKIAHSGRKIDKQAPAKPKPPQPGKTQHQAPKKPIAPKKK